MPAVICPCISDDVGTGSAGQFPAVQSPGTEPVGADDDRVVLLRGVLEAVDDPDAEVVAVVVAGDRVGTASSSPPVEHAASPIAVTAIATTSRKRAEPGRIM
nr:hypothetical protein ISGA_11305 [Gordonia sp. NB41Y]